MFRVIRGVGRETDLEFQTKLSQAWADSQSRLCVGLDPILERMPSRFRSRSRPVLAFNKWIVDLVGDLACAFKPQHAHHAAVAAEADLAETIAYIRARHPRALVILDAKRGDIGSTAEMYAREAFDRYDADAVTVNPFMGDESVLPFLERPDRGAVVLCRTTNPDAGRVQRLPAGNQPLFAAIAERAERVWNAKGNVMLVVGGSIADVLAAGRSADGRGLVVAASRSILYAGDADAVRGAAEDAHRALMPGTGKTR